MSSSSAVMAWRPGVAQGPCPERSDDRPPRFARVLPSAAGCEERHGELHQGGARGSESRQSGVPKDVTETGRERSGGDGEERAGA